MNKNIKKTGNKNKNQDKNKNKNDNKKKSNNSKSGNGKSSNSKNMGYYLKNTTLQCSLIGIFTLAVSFAIILNGAVPKRYKLYVGMISPYDITAPRNIENTILTEERAEEIAASVPYEIIRKDNVPIEILNCVDDFFVSIEGARRKISLAVSEKKLTENSANYREEIESIREPVIKELQIEMDSLNLSSHISEEQLKYLATGTSDDEVVSFKKAIRALISEVMTNEITVENLAAEIDKLQNELLEHELNQELVIIGNSLLKGLIRPNSEIDEELTETKRKEAYENSIENNKIIVKSGSRVVSVGDTITEDKMQMLRELNLVETGSVDYAFAIGIFIMLVLLSALLLLFIRLYNVKMLKRRNDVIVLCMTILLTLIIARFVFIYSPLLIPFSMATMLIAILFDRKLAIVVNCFIAVAISFMSRENLTFLYMALISGTFTAFFISKVNQRSALTSTGLLTAVMNVFVVVCMGMINKSEWKLILTDSLTVSANGLISVVMTIGILPFWESTFNLVTPFKLMELGNPNQVLLKRLLIEAPGTYHHSLMVGNLAEVAAEALGGNYLLARVGAYYHDVGKLKRPNFFIENQMSRNPHDKMAPSLSAMVIISHANDGVKLAEKHKLPYAIRDIIEQHHGSTLVTYFYHKAQKEMPQDKQPAIVSEESYRYPGPKPLSKEAAVVMLADSVEAAVRSMVDRTEGKIEGLVRKIIKERLEDGQLDLSELTLKDLDVIANSFMRVFSGFFHAREQYPDIKIKNKALEDNIHELPGTDEDEKAPVKVNAGMPVKADTEISVKTNTGMSIKVDIDNGNDIDNDNSNSNSNGNGNGNKITPGEDGMQQDGNNNTKYTR